MSVAGIMDAYEKEITVYGREDLALTPEECGLKASPTRVFKSFTPPPKGKGEMLSGTVNEMAAELTDRLRKAHLI